MKNRSSYAVLTRFGIIAAILATLVLIAPAATAQEVGGECNSDFECTYLENGKLPVATFSATDEDGDDIDWDVDGVDKGAFEIDGGVLTFKDPPNFEKPTDGDEKADEAGDQGKGDNKYLVTVKASGGSQAVEVTVTNKDEDGSVSFDQPQPQATRDLKASFSDEDGDDSPSWQWSRGPSDEGPWTEIAGAQTAARKPTTADIGSYLQATVTYEDSFDDQTASGVTANAVEPRTLANAPPSFGDVDAIEVDEGVKGAIGDPIVASDGDNDILLYSIVADVDGDDPNDTLDDAENVTDDEKFSIGGTTGQLSLKDKQNFESAGNRVAEDTDAQDDDTIPYTVTIRATDPSGATGDKTVTVNLKDVNESPAFTAPSKDQKTLYIDENEAATTLYTHKTARVTANEAAAYDAEDNDATRTAGDELDDDAAIRYTLEGAGDDEDAFSLDDETGALTSAKSHNHEKQPSYSLTIVATSGGDDPDDRGDRTRIGKMAVTVTVIDKEDPGSVTLSAREPQVGRSVLAKLSDPDGGETAVEWQWYLGGASDTEVSALVALVDNPDAVTNDVCGDDGNADEVDTTNPCVIGGASSALYTPGADDVGHLLHAVATYKDDIASDQDLDTDGDQLEETAREVSERPVERSDPGNTAPVFPDQDLNTAGDQSETAMRSVPENKKGEKIGEPITAGDGDDDLLIYTIRAEDTANFSVGRKDGQLSTKVKLDYESLPEDAKYHMVMVTATDPSGAYDMINVMIEVTDEDDAPTISLGGVAPAPEPEPTHPCVVGGAVAADQSADLAADCQTLLDIMDDLVGDGTALDWSAETPIDDWQGIAAGTGRVTGIYLADSGLAGEIPAGISGLDALTKLTLRDNDLGGDIPDLSGLDNLEWLVLHRNAFTGSIPGWLGDMESLDYLYIYSNEGGFEGGVPAGLGSSTSLRQVWLHDNGLTGGIPAEIGDMSRLRYLILSGNMLTGAIPAGLANATNLKQLYLNDNMLSGAIPAELGSIMTAADDTLRRLYLHNNMLSGDVPSELGNLVSLTHLRLSGNMLTGCIPAAIFGAADDMAGLEACTDDGNGNGDGGNGNGNGDDGNGNGNGS